MGKARNNFKNLGFIQADIFQKQEVKKDVLEHCLFRSCYKGLNTVTDEEEKKMFQNFRRKIDRRYRMLYEAIERGMLK